MIVVAHGNVDEYCERHDLVIGERYSGKLEDYSGDGLILVTDNCEDKNDYYYLKYQMLRRKITLISTHWEDADLSDFVEYMSRREAKKRKQTYGGRAAFGFRRVDGELVPDSEAMEVVRRIFALRDNGAKYKDIQADEGVHHLDGRRMSMSTIQVILKNREKYEDVL